MPRSQSRSKDCIEAGGFGLVTLQLGASDKRLACRAGGGSRDPSLVKLEPEPIFRGLMRLINPSPASFECI